ncbi:hypothetical protein pdam_00005950 [Pocillopora damicornis]|uniref:Uncharacterized protein n=1 Tax=Pocillopora damicornis TaxID=46731 RepID=A0A3M6TDX4_POCDA|nr:hypothetical protein pdam_00005950 [Pocillopora damicornis]
MAGTEGDTAYVPLKISFIVPIMITSIARPFTILPNVLVIKSVKTTTRPRSSRNILPSCVKRAGTLENFFSSTLAVLTTAPCLHLMLVTFERLMAIKFTMQYSNFIAGRNLKTAVMVV